MKNSLFSFLGPSPRALVGPWAPAATGSAGLAWLQSTAPASAPPAFKEPAA